MLISTITIWLSGVGCCCFLAAVKAEPEVLLKHPVALECVDESALFQNTYHAPPRTVPFLPTDPAIKRGFLELFRREFSPGHDHGSPQDLDTLETMCKKNSLDQETVDGINDLLARDDTLNSFSDRNLMAVGRLEAIFMRATSPEDLLRLAREQLHRHTFNQKTWYYALIGALIARNDLNGTLVAWPIDATPDLYITYSLLQEARKRTARPSRVNNVRNCTTVGNIFYTEVRYRPSSTAPQDVTGASAAAQQAAGGRSKRGFKVYEFLGGWGEEQKTREEEVMDLCAKFANGQGGSDDPGEPSKIPYPTKEYKEVWVKQPHLHYIDHWHPPQTLHGWHDHDHHHHHHHPPEKGWNPPHQDNGWIPPKKEWRQPKNEWHQHQQPQRHHRQRRPVKIVRNSQGSWGKPNLPFFDLLPDGILDRKKRSSQERSSSSTRVKDDDGGRRRSPDNGKRGRRQSTNNNGTGSGSSRTTNRCLHYNGTTGATGEENRLWYFREDMLLNQHHWYWHQYFPKIGQTVRDRRGEIFFFAHHTIVARYNAERLSNGLPIETPLEFRENSNIGPGYYADLIDENTGRFWTLRLPNTPLSDIIQKGDRNYGFNMKINTVANAFSTLIHHVKQGYLLVNRTDEEPYPLNIRNQDGLSHLGNTVEEAPRLTANRDLYQSVHSLGHLAISVATDPDFRCKLLKGVMSDVAVAMRDPAFFRVHSLVDTLYSNHKSTLPPYQLHGGEWPLQWDGVRLQSLDVVTTNQPKINYGPEWSLKTFWSVRRFPLEEGIDGSIHEGDVKADICHQHLNHEPFTFKLTIDMDSCAKTVSNKGTVRIFMAPRRDLDGRRFTMEETRHLMFQLDAFPVELRRGRNTITRYSQDSSATKPWSRSLTEMLNDPDNGGQAEYCGCGWPRHLYIPKGSPHGTEFDLFAMVTNFDEDQVIDPIETLDIPETCISPYLYCGRPNRKYPDARPMGYPFDRVPFPVYEHKQVLHEEYGHHQPFLKLVKVLRPMHDLEEYVAQATNMQSSVLVIQHVDKIMA